MLVAFGFILGCSGFPTSSNNTPQVTISWADSNSIVCYGTGFTYGVGGRHDTLSNAGPDSTYPGFLQEALKINVVNFGTPGALTTYGVNHIDSVLTFNPVLVLLEFGAEDYFYEYAPSEDARPDLETMITAFQSHGVKVVLLSFANPQMKNLYPNDAAYDSLIQLGIDYSKMYQSLAADYNIPMVDYLFRDIWGDPALMSDEIHPDGKGYLQMERNVMESLYSIFRDNDMLK